VRLAELHDVDAVLTQRRPDGRCGVGGAGLDLKLDQTRNLLLRCHCFSFSVRAASRPLSRLPSLSGARWTIDALELGDLIEAELHGSLALEEGDEHGELAALGLDLADRTGQACERALL